MTRHSLRGLVRALGLAAALGGCVVSSQSVIAPAESTFDERLLGTWEEIGGPDRTVVTRGDSGAYAIRFTDDRDTLRLAGRLGRLGGRLTLDVWPVPEENEISGYEGLLLAAHVAVVLDVGAKEVAYSILEPDSLLRVLRGTPGAARYEAAGRRVVLHGSTAELHTLLAPHIGRPGMLSQVTRMRRVAAPGGTR